MSITSQQHAAVARSQSSPSPENSPSPNFESQLSDLTGELNSQFSIAKGKFALSSLSDSTLIKNSSHIEAIRRHLFSLDISLVWFEAEWNMYFPYVNNFWVHNQTSKPTRKSIVIVYWWCRFWRDAVKFAGTDKKLKKIRDVPKCICIMKMMKQLNAVEEMKFMTLSLSRSQHNHDQNFADRTKLNEEINQSFKAKIEKNYTSAEVHRNAQGTHRDVNVAALKAAEDSALTLQSVYNADKNYLRRNKNPRILSARDEWKQQMTNCYEFLQNQGEEMLSEILTAKRLIDEQINHVVVFAHRDQLLFPFELLLCILTSRASLTFWCKTSGYVNETRLSVFHEFHSQYQRAQMKALYRHDTRRVRALLILRPHVKQQWEWWYYCRLSEMFTKVVQGLTFSICNYRRLRGRAKSSETCFSRSSRWRAESVSFPMQNSLGTDAQSQAGWG